MNASNFYRYLFVSVSLIGVTLLLSGCATTRFSANQVGPPNINDPIKYAHIKVFYGTDRRPEAARNNKIMYGSKRNDQFTYGTCDVYLPKELPKVLVYPTLWRLDFMEDPTHLMVISRVAEIDKKAFFDDLSLAVASTPEKKVFLFIHGFNMTFEDAARRTAQISYYIGPDTVPVFYSWPSMGKLWGYLADEDNVEWTHPHLRQFLEDVATRSGAKTIYLMAHSMGNRALTNALLLSKPTEQSLIRHKSLFSSIIMAAPDIDQDIFKRDIAPFLKLTGASVTIYVSANDNALKVSRGLHNDKRVGEIEDGGPFIIDGMDTIDVSGIDDSFTGHGYYFNSIEVLTDIGLIMKAQLPPNLRPNLKPIKVNDASQYWRIIPR